eukprot:COSAG06_NODE_3289_length_5550_cov_26.579894_3_plen_167_part_00
MLTTALSCCAAVLCRLKGRELYTAGIATHFVPSENIPQLEAALVQLSQDGASTGAIDKAIAEYGEGRTDAAVADALAGRDPEAALANIDEINEAFEAPTVAEILTRVRGHTTHAHTHMHTGAHTYTQTQTQMKMKMQMETDALKRDAAARTLSPTQLQPDNRPRPS